ncbi:MAG: 7-carboxy-7-deazaguanine synthase QueE [Bacteroidota bacterium]
MEEFYSLQGEGYHTGSAAYFTRIGGCDVGCSWCDIKESWDASKYPPVDVDKIVRNAAIAEAKAVVVTGGEPLLYNLDYFCRELKKAGIKTYLETSGSSPLSGEWDWICLSPKKHAPPLPEICSLANELKVIIEEPEDFSWAEENIKYLNPVCLKYLQPEWSERETITPLITEYIKKNPSWKISIQSHKFIGIP